MLNIDSVLQSRRHVSQNLRQGVDTGIRQSLIHLRVDIDRVVLIFIVTLHLANPGGLTFKFGDTTTETGEARRSENINERRKSQPFLLVF